MATPPKDEEEKVAEVAPAAASPSSPNRQLYIVLIAVLLLLPLMGWGMAYFLIGQRGAGTKSDPEVETSHDKGKKETGSTKDGAKIAEGEGFSLIDLVVNIKGTRGTRFLRCSKMTFDAPDAVLAELRTRKDQIADIVTAAMSSKKLEEVEADDARVKLKIEVSTLVNSILKAGEISNIYLTDYVIQ